MSSVVTHRKITREKEVDVCNGLIPTIIFSVLWISPSSPLFFLLFVSMISTMVG